VPNSPLHGEIDLLGVKPRSTHARYNRCFAKDAARPVFTPCR
jgi:hypothetical protein